jgi:hypothetical protein
MLGGVGIEPDSIGDINMFILRPEHCTGGFMMGNLGEVVC